MIATYRGLYKSRDSEKMSQRDWPWAYFKKLDLPNRIAQGENSWSLTYQLHVMLPDSSFECQEHQLHNEAVAGGEPGELDKSQPTERFKCHALEFIIYL